LNNGYIEIHGSHILNSSSGGLVNHSPGLKYIVTKYRCIMALTPPG